MTTSVPHDPSDQAAASRSWPIERAAASFGDIASLAQHHGPQHVTEDGRDVVVVMSARDYQRMSRTTGQALIDAMQACPDPELFDRIEALRSGRDDGR